MPDLNIEERAQRLTIYIGEADHWRGKPLYAALVDTLKAQGLAGATVLRGVAGFGAHSRVHTAAILRLSEDLPLRIEVVDSVDKISRALEAIHPMVTEGLITLEDVRVIKYTHRYLHPLPGQRRVDEVMTHDVVTLLPEMRLADAWDRMLTNMVKALPVVDKENRVVGMLTDEDLLNRAGFGQRLAVAERLDEGLVSEEMQNLRALPLHVGDVMKQPAITVPPQESLGAAAARMAKAGIKRLPVVNSDGKLVGVLSRSDILKQLTDAQPRAWKQRVPEGAHRTIGEIMSPEIPSVPATAELADIVDRFVQLNTHRLIVCDEQGQALGLLSDADVVSRIQPQHRRSVLDALRGRGPAPETQVAARDIMSPEVLTLPADTPLIDAARTMLKSGRKWMIVTDAENHPVGLLDRQLLLKAVTSA